MKKIVLIFIFVFINFNNAIASEITGKISTNMKPIINNGGGGNESTGGANNNPAAGSGGDDKAVNGTNSPVGGLNMINNPV